MTLFVVLSTDGPISEEQKAVIASTSSAMRVPSVLSGAAGVFFVSDPCAICFRRAHRWHRGELRRLQVSRLDAAFDDSDA